VGGGFGRPFPETDMQVNGHKISLATILAVVMAVGTMAGSWFVWGQQAGQLQGKVLTLEERAKEDRKDTRQNIGEVKEHVKVIDQNVQVILQKITAMEAVQKSERRRER
jgi:uncharacterized protein HemX